MKDKRVIYLKDFPVERQVEIILNAEEFWDYLKKDAEIDDYSLDAILKRNGVTNEKIIAKAKERNEIRRKLHHKKYRLIIQNE